jgi:DNA-binding response OmpR family regulator
MKTIAILNENESDIDSLLYILGNHYDILIALNITEAIELLEEESIDLFLVSLDLTDQQGVNYFKILLNQKKIPTIFSTEKSNQTDQTINLIIKSFNEEELLTKIEQLL